MRVQPVEPSENRERFGVGRTTLHGAREKAARRFGIAFRKRGEPAMHELFRLALALGDRAACPLDVRARSRVAAVEEQTRVQMWIASSNSPEK